MRVNAFVISLLFLAAACSSNSDPQTTGTNSGGAGGSIPQARPCFPADGVTCSGGLVPYCARVAESPAPIVGCEPAAVDAESLPAWCCPFVKTKTISAIVVLCVSACSPSAGPPGFEPLGGAGSPMSAGDAGPADGSADAAAGDSGDPSADAAADAYPPPPCECIDEAGACQSGGSLYACGVGGAACMNCGALTTYCASWSCVVGACSVQWMNDGLPCPGGTCQAGKCEASAGY